MASRDRYSGRSRRSERLQTPGRPPMDQRELAARRTAERKQQRDRQVRRRRLVFGVAGPLLVLLGYFGISYGSYMTQPTSMTFAERSAEWVRNDVPFGNWIIDTAEHYTASAPAQGRSRAQAPAPGRPRQGRRGGQARRHCRLRTAADQAGLQPCAAR